MIKQKKLPSLLVRGQKLFTGIGHWIKKYYKRFLIILLTLLCVWLVAVIWIGLWYQHAHRNDPFVLGVSFSEDYAKELGNNWQANYLALMNIGIKNFRLMSYWNDLEPAPGKYNFTDLDWQMSEAAAHGAKVTLAIGKRQPRWPECHIPSWANALPQTQQNQQLLDFLKTVVNRYKNSSALISYQLENEDANRLFSPFCQPFNRPLLRQELAVVKAADPNHPVDINVSNQTGIPLIGPIGDQVGFSIYRKVYAVLGPIHLYFSYDLVPAVWHSYRAGVVQLLFHKTTFVHELQAEPWGPKATENMTSAEQAQSMTAEGIKQNVDYAYSTGMHTMYLWGGEWWYWRKTKFNDPSEWNMVKSLVQQGPYPKTK
jgi:hypothetical protein